MDIRYSRGFFIWWSKFLYSTINGGYIIAGKFSNVDDLILTKADSNGDEKCMKVIEEDCTIDVYSIQQNQ